MGQLESITAAATNEMDEASNSKGADVTYRGSEISKKKKSNASKKGRKYASGWINESKAAELAESVKIAVNTKS